ncbi:hypothetical protein [Corynebacterium sp. UBA2622]|uniref:hypothetical protein n=1 Tax=Corynebacterium sp. UBA2622 TaxID=1946393 RepID=UPI0025BAD6D1|nr:hypothetical protein [Corynebacterium sp. UBA2622]
MIDLGQVADLVGAGASLAALAIARQANQLAKATADETSKHVAESNRVALEASQKAEAHALEADERERERDQRGIASNMQAWWVKEDTSAKGRWGILVSTTGAINSVFFEVVLHVKANEKPLSIQVATLPPGQYFIESVWGAEGLKFISPRPVSSSESFLPLLHAESHTVEEISFRDQLGKQWTWKRGTGLMSSN